MVNDMCKIKRLAATKSRMFKDPPMGHLNPKAKEEMRMISSPDVARQSQKNKKQKVHSADDAGGRKRMTDIKTGPSKKQRANSVSHATRS